MSKVLVKVSNPDGYAMRIETRECPECHYSDVLVMVYVTEEFEEMLIGWCPCSCIWKVEDNKLTILQKSARIEQKI